MVCRKIHMQVKTQAYKQTKLTLCNQNGANVDKL